MQYRNKVLVVGEKSFISKALTGFDRVSYKNFQHVDLSQYGVVMNCALNPAYKISPYRQDIDVDYVVGHSACVQGCHYIMLSTSKVYKETTELVVCTETSETSPSDYYGTNKLITERKLLEEFPNQITILRGSNIFGFEYGRNSFVGYCMSQLVNEGQITFTISSKIKRDFIFIDDAVTVIKEVCQQLPLGIYNLSSNQPLEVRRVAENLIKGYKYGGTIRSVSEKIERQFALDNTKLKTNLGIEIGPYDFDSIFQRLGQQLSNN